MSSTDYTAMWKDLGIDLEGHGQLMQVLGKFYGDIYLSQENRPAGTAYLDFVISEIHGLRVKELQDAKAAGKKVVGTFCLYVPEELVLAANGVCVGLCAGADIGTEQAERMLPRNTCALIKSFFGFKLAKLCPYVESCDLIIGETTCDGKTKAYELFGELADVFVIEVPNTKSGSAGAHWRSELGRLKTKLEELTGSPITAERLAEATRVVNAKRRALIRLNELRKADPAPISGRDALLVNQIAFYDDPVRFTSKIDELCDELEERVKNGVGVAPKGTPRVLVSGCPMAAPNWKVPFIVEKNGAVIVGEESCVGERGTRNLVDESGRTVDEMLDRIAERYFRIDCAVFTPNPERTRHVVDMAKGYGADGVVHYTLQFCTPYAMETTLVDRALRKEALPTLRLETDYSMEDFAQLETRVQAFLETLE